MRLVCMDSGLWTLAWPSSDLLDHFLESSRILPSYSASQPSIWQNTGDWKLISPPCWSLDQLWKQHFICCLDPTCWPKNVPSPLSSPVRAVAELHWPQALFSGILTLCGWKRTHRTNVRYLNGLILPITLYKEKRGISFCLSWLHLSFSGVSHRPSRVFSIREELDFEL